MRTATWALFGPIISLVTLGAASCGGDDSSTTTATTGSAGAGGSGSGVTTAGSGGSGGKSTGTGGAGGSSSDAGAGCPPAQPPANTACDLDHDCVYGGLTCSCVDMLWTCNGAPPEGGAGCPMADPDPNESCTVQGLVCTYGGGLVCTCDTQTGWTCVQATR